jgi:hypothetical protein
MMLLTRHVSTTQARGLLLMHTICSGKSIDNQTPKHLLEKVVPLNVLPQSTHACRQPLETNINLRGILSAQGKLYKLALPGTPSSAHMAKL